MWKENYRIGVESIDSQHIKLFEMTDELVKAVNTNLDEEKFRQSMDFMKNYVVTHFSDEEAYQASIGYEGMEEHKKIHRDFTNVVMKYEKKMIETNYDVKVMKNFAGMLTSWLIYHVTYSDQKIIGNKLHNDGNELNFCIESFAHTALDVFKNMAEISPAVNIEKSVSENNDIYIEIEIFGDFMGSVLFGYSKEFAFKLVSVLTLSYPKEFDEFVCSVLGEIANIVCGNVAAKLSSSKTKCYITIPAFYFEDIDKSSMDSVLICTDIGEFEMILKID